jgi:hypothetical protein
MTGQSQGCGDTSLLGDCLASLAMTQYTPSLIHANKSRQAVNFGLNEFLVLLC